MNISNFRNQLDALKKAIPPAPSAAADLRKLARTSRSARSPRNSSQTPSLWPSLRPS